MKRGSPLGVSLVLASSLVACTGVIRDRTRDAPGTNGGASSNPDQPMPSSGYGGSMLPSGSGGSMLPSGPGKPAPAVFSCDPSARPAELPLPRLSRAQLEGTLRFAIRLALPDEESEVWSKVSAEWSRYPAETKTPALGDLRGGYARIDQSIQQTQIDAMYATASAIAQELTGSATRISSMLGRCATDDSSENDRECLDAFIASWGARVMRSPLTADDVAYYAGDAGSTPVSPAAVANVITAILNAPQTLYRVEHGTENSKPVSALSPFEVAARLALHFWQAPPDDELWSAAEDGSVLDLDVYGAELDRLAQGPQARAALNEFVAQWLRLEELPPLDALNADPMFMAFAGAQLPPASTRQAMIDDVLASVWNTLSSGGTLSDFLNDRHSYAEDPYLAGIYQTAPWDGAGTPPLFPSARRSGLLTRAAMLATGTAGTRPIHKGYLVRNALLCQQVGAPPANVDTNPPMPDATVTTRQAVTELTSGGVCGGCHLHIINPPGFITEGFDGLGRERSEEKLFDAQGTLVASLPIDTAAVPMLDEDDARSMDDAVELSQAIDESRLYHSCMARHYFRFAMSRFEAPEQDGCLLSELEVAARNDEPLVDVLKAVARSPTFKAKRFE
jgi:hypothetical protein